jgi:hypothetical protein
LEENLRAADMTLTATDVGELDAASNPGTPYPQWMVRQLDEAEDPRRRALDPADKGFADLRGARWPPRRD